MKEKIVIETSSYMVEKAFCKSKSPRVISGKNLFYESIRGVA